MWKVILNYVRIRYYWAQMRRIIRFKPELLDLVVKGLKTSTVRPANGAVYCRDLILTDGRRRVPAELVSVRQLSFSEALHFYASEGFPSPEKFIESITSIYPHLKPSDKVTYIEFRLK